VSKAAAPQLNPRDIIAKKYEIDSLLGVGAQGATYLARDMASGRKVALKMLAGPPASDEVAQAVLRRSQALVHDSNGLCDDNRHAGHLGRKSGQGFFDYRK
jgi:serine/threonine protein kinase